MLNTLSGFIDELRSAGLPVSMVEAVDGLRALEHTDLGDREAFKAALGATLVKSARHYAAFDTAFEVYFALHRPELPEPEAAEGISGGSAIGRGGASGGEADIEDMLSALFAAFQSGDMAHARALARMAVDRLADMEKGRPVGGTYYLYRTLRALDLEVMLNRLLEETHSGGHLASFEERLMREEYETLISQFRAEVEAEIRRRLVADRGHQAVARSLRRPLLEETDLLHASREQLADLEQVVHPLTRKLMGKLTRRRKRSKRGPLDFRRTIRNSLATGGVPLDPRFRRPHPSKPEVFLLCDVSGSMSTFARFTLQFAYAMSSQFSRLRSFAFVDTVDEVTELFRPGTDFGWAMTRLAKEARVVWLDGHSDYGNVLEQFVERYGSALTPKTTLIITGDARTNYRSPRAHLLAEIADRVRAVYWLNPESTGFWDTGDSVFSSYADHCDGVFEVRNLRQLEDFVSQVAVGEMGRPAQVSSR